MQADIDHVVLWVDDPLRAVAFYAEVVGFEPVRLAEFEASKVPFPSVRLSPTALLDLAPRKMAALLNGIARKTGLTNDAAGHPTNHVCLTMAHDDFVALRARLQTAGVDTSFALKDSFGARGVARDAFYFADPDGNIIEARYYESATAG
jgi:catechol 2,3-dioxygenase-like lactoylglutathione lyase family enzyme